MPQVWRTLQLLRLSARSAYARNCQRYCLLDLLHQGGGIFCNILKTKLFSSRNSAVKILGLVTRKLVPSKINAKSCAERNGRYESIYGIYPNRCFVEGEFVFRAEASRCFTLHPFYFVFRDCIFSELAGMFKPSVELNQVSLLGFDIAENRKSHAMEFPTSQ